MVAYLFAGQGSQYIGMGKDLYESFPKAQAIFDKADRVLGFSLTKLCFEGPENELKKTQNCQPAILTMSIAALEAFKSTVYGLQSTVSYVAGLSLGEYSALVASRAISFEDAVYLVRCRGEFMEEEALKNPGRMLSIIGLDLDNVQKICRETKTEIANINCPGQTVISGGPKDIDEAKIKAQKLGAKMAVILEVSGAFHSSFMQGATVKLAQELEKIKINFPKVPVICNVTAKPAASALEIKENLIKQVASSVLWEDSMKFAIAQGITNFMEFGPGKVLRGLLRRIDSNVKTINIEKKEDIEAVGSS
ncbi:MAG: ACP S-malonyltransferase [Candidatus Omnitrophota bacterium]